ncbi:uncharacterized protein LOC105688007 isoform X2 [Athalia rosae]|uniref:uncharacterized protein LOC105688007 isoform X2 n=1 Tax=Athalia rosae TaxID=37344 RepID=UPI00203427FE|nr:uncharacterized protein LOC105688007 isoform X2 [Athalia rosae]
MSHHNSPYSQRKKIPKNPHLSLHNNYDKLKKVTSTTSSDEITEVQHEIQNGGETVESTNLQSNMIQSAGVNHFLRQYRNFLKHDEYFLLSSSRSQIIGFTSNEKNKHHTNNAGKTAEIPTPQLLLAANCSALEEGSGLMGVLSKKLYLAESQMHRMQVIMSKADAKLTEKDAEISRLKRKVRDWEMKFKSQENVHKKEIRKERKQVEDSEYLYKRCLMLEHQIYEMEKFLADYGLVWIGNDNKTHKSSCNEQKLNNDYLKTCYKQLIANIEKLNLTLGEGEVHVHHEKEGIGASFKTSSSMSLKFYKNGLVVQNGCIRPYEDAGVACFVRDILDGYFPTELQKLYPNGVPFKVEDRRTEVFRGPGSVFAGQGHRLGKSIPGETVSPEGNRNRTSSNLQRQNFCSPKPTVPPLFFACNSIRSPKSKSSQETQSSEMMQLRSQILASHNNNCSESHIQSHINADLGLTPRMEKKRELATKETEFKISVRDQTFKIKHDNRVGSRRFCSNSGISKNNSTERSSGRYSHGRLESTCSDNRRSYSRSTSLPGRKLKIRSLSKLRTLSGKAAGTSDCETISNMGVKRPRVTKSATLQDRKFAEPLSYQINEPTGKPGELKLKVRSLNGCMVFLVHLDPDDTVARLYQLLDTCVFKNRSRIGYKVVISGYTPKRLVQLGVSLREYGILRDSVLHIVND